MVQTDLNFGHFHGIRLNCTGSVLRTKHTNLTLITLMMHDHMIGVGLITCNLFIILFSVHYCMFYLEIKDNTMVKTLQASPEILPSRLWPIARLVKLNKNLIQ